MKWCRFQHEGRVCEGRIEGERVLELGPEGAVISEHGLQGLQWLPPVEHPRIFGIGRNYAEHIRELNPGWSAPEPLVFMKPDSALCAHGDVIRLPAGLGRIDYEGELAVVLARGGRAVPLSESMGLVGGYTLANDISARELQKSDGQWIRAKGFDTFCPLGPWITDEVDPADLALRTTLNGKIVQEGRSSQMIHGIPALLSFLSSFCTLRAGDVILTGTPAGVGPLAPGDEIHVSVDGIGTLSNRVEAEA